MFVIAILAANAFIPDIPKTWTDAAVAALEVPLANPKYSAVHISEKEYYAMPVRTVYRSYPVYHPRHEPPGYMDWLKRQEPEIGFNASRLRSREDWIKAGELVFNAAVSFGPVFFGAVDVRTTDFFDTTGMPVANDGLQHLSHARSARRYRCAGRPGQQSR
jgi:hypothetical protein